MCKKSWFFSRFDWPEMEDLPGHYPSKLICKLIGHRWTDWKRNEWETKPFRHRHCHLCDEVQRDPLIRITLVDTITYDGLPDV